MDDACHVKRSVLVLGCDICTETNGTGKSTHIVFDVSDAVCAFITKIGPERTAEGDLVTK